MNDQTDNYIPLDTVNRDLNSQYRDFQKGNKLGCMNFFPYY